MGKLTNTKVRARMNCRHVRSSENLLCSRGILSLTRDAIKSRINTAPGKKKPIGNRYNTDKRNGLNNSV